MWTLKHGSLRRALLFITCVVTVTGYSWFAIKEYRAERFGEHSDHASIERAIALEPQDASYHDLLCRSMIFVSQEPERAINECKKASELNPYNSSIWLDLAQAYYSASNLQLNNASLRRALAVDPTTPDTTWNVANFLLIQGKTSDALDQFSIVLREEPSLAPAALNICWSSLHDITRIQSILPPNPAVYLDLINLLLSNGEPSAAHQVWSSLIALDTTFDYHRGLFYIDSLLRSGDVLQAHEAWKQLSSRSKALQAYSQPSNLVTDASFSQEILNSGFDWRYTPRPQIAVALDRADFHSGDRSLRLMYGGSGSDAGIFQYIAAQANTQYRLSAWVKSEHLETANGPMLALLDDSDNAIHSFTEETANTTPWHRVETELRTGPKTRLLILAILRRPGETRIQGNFWVDDIKLEPSYPSTNETIAHAH